MPQMTDFLKLKPGVNELENKQSDAIRFKLERNCFGMIRSKSRKQELLYSEMKHYD